MNGGPLEVELDEAEKYLKDVEKLVAVVSQTRGGSSHIKGDVSNVGEVAQEDLGGMCTLGHALFSGERGLQDEHAEKGKTNRAVLSCSLPL